MSEETIDKALLKTKSGEFDLESIHSVSLKDLGLEDLGCIGECVGLERLDLSFNSISKLHRLASLEKLESLNLSANRISSLEGLQGLENVQKLNLAGNLIGGVDSLRCLTGLEKLTSLRLKDATKGLSNPVCMNSSYRNDILRMFPNLITLDGERVKGRGSDVYKMLREIDEAIVERSEVSIHDSENQALEWVPDSYWEPSRKFEQTMLGDAEQQLQDLLTSCTRLSETADEKLQQLKSKS